MALYKVETDFGVGIREADNLQQAKMIARQDEGQYLKSVCKATDEDILWVGNMGGWLPNEAAQQYMQLTQRKSTAGN